MCHGPGAANFDEEKGGLAAKKTGDDSLCFAKPLTTGQANLKIMGRRTN
jgi:hypothetical protein